MSFPGNFPEHDPVPEHSRSMYRESSRNTLFGNCRNMRHIAGQCFTKVTMLRCSKDGWRTGDLWCEDDDQSRMERCRYRESPPRAIVKSRRHFINHTEVSQSIVFLDATRHATQHSGRRGENGARHVVEIDARTKLTLCLETTR